MKPFYKTLVLWVVLYTLGTLTAFAGVVIQRSSSPRPALEEQVRQKLSAQDTDWAHFGNRISANNCPLYASVRAGLEEYYGQTEFADPGRQSGWYRVNLFLKWLKRNEAVLKGEQISIEANGKKYTVSVCRALRKASYKETFSPLEMQGIFGVWLGARYTADMFVSGRGVRFPDMTLSRETYGRAVISSSGGKKEHGYIEIHPDSYALVPALNLGLHEGTHLAAWMTGGKNSLGEWGTFLATVHYALPVKANAQTGTYQGTRSFTHNASVPSVSCEQTFQEYAAFVLGARLYPEIRRQNFFTFEEQIGEYQDRTLLLLLRNLAAVQAGRLYVPVVPPFPRSGNSVLAALKKRYDDCPEVQGLQSLEDGGSYMCGTTRVETHQNPGTDAWILVEGKLSGLKELARAVSPRSLAPGVEKELASLSVYLEEDLKQMPLQNIVWQTSGIKDWGEFEGSSAYTRLCRKVRGYARDNPSGVPPVPAGYM